MFFIYIYVSRPSEPRSNERFDIEAVLPVLLDRLEDLRFEGIASEVLSRITNSTQAGPVVALPNLKTLSLLQT